MGSEVQKWADQAMFKAEDMPEEALDRPRVHLVWMTPDPLGAAAAMNAMYVGKVRRSLADVTHDERRQLLDDMQKTALKAPLEAIKLHFLIEGVTRGFTHQLVRQRTAVYAQESTRFAVFGEDASLPVGLPPSLQGTVPEAEFYQQSDNGGLHTGAETPAQKARLAWDDALHRIQSAYRTMVAAGMPAEDARGLLPTNLLTRIHYITDLRNLYGHAGNRLCTQAQFEWRLVFTGIADAIRNYNPYGALIRQLEEIGPHMQPVSRDAMAATADWLAESERWQYEGIADLFRPICYMTGKCEFKATADRACSIRERVDVREKHGGKDSSQWHKPFLYNETGKQDKVVSSPGINPMEWLADPAAARVQ